VTALEALGRAQVRREIAAKAKADDRTVKRVLRGIGPTNSAWERVTEAMALLGIAQASPVATTTPPQEPLRAVP
jgi:hypothetical protein